ncbi:MAG: hypothetical protein KDE57_16455 [Calditrichaeota bacterium]|nr:hypothetical protein [Calditrichota bacterium]
MVDEFYENVDDAIETLKARMIEMGLAESGDNVVFTAGLPFTQRRPTNVLRIEEL